MKKKGNINKLLRLSSIGILTLLPFATHAAGYRLEFQSPSVLADAGEAAVVEDAGTNWYNSAGIVYLPQQLTVSDIYVVQDTQFTGTATAPSLTSSTFTATGTARSRPIANLPAFHYTRPLNERVFFGFSAVPAWGLKENYGGDNSIVRYNLNRIATKTLVYSPSAGIKLNDQLSLGLGPDISYFQVQNVSNARFQLTPGVDATSRYTANSWGSGFHLGLLYRFTEATRVGINYRSKIVMHLRGYSSFSGGGGPMMETNLFRTALVQPATTTLSAYHDFNPTWAVMGTISYEEWGALQSLTGYNYIQPPAPGSLTNVTQQLDYHNTFDFSAGLHYTINPQWMLRGSLKYVATPTVSPNRDLMFPDAPKLGVNIGARYTMNKKLAVDMIYGHVFTRSVAINALNPASGATSVGTSRTHMDLVGAQLVWNI